MNNKRIELKSIIKDKSLTRIAEWSESNPAITDLVEFLIEHYIETEDYEKCADLTKYKNKLC